MPAILPITDELLINAIGSASQRIVIIAPGVWPPIASAVSEAWKRLGKDRVTVILDVDPDICRIGYGSLEGIKILQQAANSEGEVIGQEPGIRICVCIVDNQTFVFSPTPRLLEAPTDDTLSPESKVLQIKANGLTLCHPPDSLVNQLGQGENGATERTLGLDSLNAQKLQNVAEELKKNPPKNFDLSRAVSVYNAHVQFVEFKLEGCKLSDHRAQLPKHFIHVLKKNPSLSRKIENSIKLLDEEDSLLTDKTLSQDTLFTQREKIQDQYLRPVKGVGTVIERGKKADFSKEVQTLKAEVEQFAKSVEVKLAQRFQQTAEQLADEILDEVLVDLPERWKKKFGVHPDPQRVRWNILEDLLKAFGTPSGKVGKMKVEDIFKDVTYDMLTDPEFREQMNGYFPGLPLMSEDLAIKARKDDQPPLF